MKTLALIATIALSMFAAACGGPPSETLEKT